MASQPDHSQDTRRAASHMRRAQGGETPRAAGASVAGGNAAGDSVAGGNAAGDSVVSVRSAGVPASSARADVPLASDDDRIQTIGAGQGARVTTRDNAAEAAGRARAKTQERYLARHPEARVPATGPARSGKNVLALVLLAVAALTLLFFLVRCAALGLSATQEQTSEEQEAQTETPEEPETATAAPDAALTYDGTTFSLAVQESGRWGLVSGDAVLFEVEGTPISLMRYKDVILIPEDRDGSWDVVCYSLGGNASYVVDANGAMVTGSGSISEAVLDGDVIHVSDSTGQVTDVSLV